MYALSYLFSIVGVLLSVAFFTLLERKIMSLMHYRVGPNKVVLYGVAQPMSDAAKLLTKEAVKLSMSKMLMFTLGPFLSLALMILVWGVYEFSYTTMSPNMKTLMILAIMSLTAYGFILTSWGSNSKYAMIGGLRAIAQVVSYEVCLVLFLLVVIYVVGAYKVKSILLFQEGLCLGLFVLPFTLSWIMLCMAESNRTPFDLAEGESELVSGFNVEYGGGVFALIFIAEYGMIMFISALTSMFFFGSSMIMLKTMLMCVLFIWVRCAFPRVKYDKLMNIAWKLCLPYSLIMLMVCSSLCLVL